MEVLNREQQSVVAEVTLGYRPKIRPSQRPTVHTSSNVYDILIGFWNMDQIELKTCACSIIVAHNHLVESEAEQCRIMLTNRSLSAGKIWICRYRAI